MRKVSQGRAGVRGAAGDGREAPHVSVVVATIGRGRLLVQTVRGLLRNDYPSFEIVVVDQTPDPEPDVLAFMQRNAPRVRYVRRRRPGLPEARNAGVREARGDVVLFVDDDVVVERGLIAAHARSYREDGVGGVAGRVVPSGVAGHKPERRPGRVAKMRWAGLVLRDNFDATVRTGADHVRGCNMSFLRRVIVAAGGFDGRFGGSAHLEETDLAVRVRAHGYRLVFEPDAALVHLLERAGGCRPARPQDWFFWYGHNVCLFYRKNFSASVFLLSCVRFFARLPFSAIKNGSLGAVVWGTRGFIEGLKTYRRDDLGHSRAAG